MRGIDILIIVVLVSAVVFSGIGVATYESLPQHTDYRVTWSTTTTQLAQKSATQTGNGEQQIQFPIDLDNMTRAKIDVSVNGPGPRAQAVTAQVTLTPVNASAPAPQSITLGAGQGGTPGSVSFTVDLADLPNQETASGVDENATYAALDEQYRTSNGTGTWIVKVVISGAREGPVGGIGSETFTINVSGEATTYRAVLQVLTPEIER